MIKLKLVREAAKVTLGEAATYCGVPNEEMERLEEDPGEMPASMVTKLRRIYKFPIDYVALFLVFGLRLVS